MNDMIYEGRIFRPPSEANSLIIQSTIGCSHNRCAFCSMYKEKQFRIRPVVDVLNDFAMAHKYYGRIPRVFLADGDAFMRNAGQQLELLSGIKSILPECERITCYASPKSIAVKTDAELDALCAAGLDMIYLGLESGSDNVLSRINKGCTVQEIVTAAQRAKRAGLRLSVTAILGLGGCKLSVEHAILTASALSLIKADYIGLLSLMLESGTPLYYDHEHGAFDLLSAEQMLLELRSILLNIDSEKSVFRANHASNYINLAGTLNADRETLIKKLDVALYTGKSIKDECLRGL